MGDALYNAADQVTGGQLSFVVNTAQAVSSDINGGDGSNTGRVIGNVAANRTIAVATTKMGQAIGGVMKEAGVITKSATAGESTISPNVQNILNNLKELKSGGELLI